MVGKKPPRLVLAVLLLAATLDVGAQEAGGLRGTVFDRDFEVPLGNATVLLAETNATTTTNAEGNYVFGELEPGTYTVVFSREGYTRVVNADVVVSPGRLTELDASLSGDFAEMEEFVVQDVQFGTGTEVGLLELRLTSPALIDSVSAELISRSGAGDAADALTLVSGATVEDGKFPVIRGLPDRYVNSQLNGVRLPTADAEKRAVELDQFPSDAIESIQVSKTFTPDQQGDASGGAVNIVLKKVPRENTLSFGASTGFNSQVYGQDDFLTYDNSQLRYWGKDNLRNDIQTENLGGNWEGAVGASEANAPTEYSWDVSAGGSLELDNEVRIGAFASLFYDRGYSHSEDGIDDQYWITEPGAELTPQFSQGTPTDGDFVTSLFDVTESTREIQWGSLGVIGIETENHSVSLTGFYSRTTTDSVIFAEDTRGKEYYYPGYDPDDPSTPGHEDPRGAPYLRLQTLTYQERESQSVILSGRHKFPDPGLRIEGFFEILGPEIDWTKATSLASFNEPDKRQFGALWVPEQTLPARPPFVPERTIPASYFSFKPGAVFTLGNLQRIYREIIEESDQFAINFKLPFEQWTESEGFVKVGYFHDQVDRVYFQETFSNFADNSSYVGGWEDRWTDAWEEEDHPITEGLVDVDYVGDQEIEAWYWMVDLPLTAWLNIIGGYRYERTELSIVNTPEEQATWFPPGARAIVELNPGDADVSFLQDDILPMIGFKLQPVEPLIFRGSYSETVARQTFRELTPILQQEFLGGPIFIGNPELTMSAVKNYDLRLDYTPYTGGLVSVSYFKKDIEDAIENVQNVVGFVFTTPVNYPEGRIIGWEFELRQDLGRFVGFLEGLSLGGNATLIDSEVTLPPEEQELFRRETIQIPLERRDMTNAPEYLYNVYGTYNMDKIGLPWTSLSVFYTVRGDTLVAGAGIDDNNFVPSVYETEFGTLNATLSQRLGRGFNLKFSAKNLLNPEIETVYRSEFTEQGDVTKTSYKKGIDFSVGLSASF